MKKVSRQAVILLFILIILLILIFGYFLMPKITSAPQDKSKYSVALVEENKKIVSTYINSISKETETNDYKEYKIKLKKDEKINNYLLGENQIFSKYLKLEAPNGKDALSKSNNHVITHYAYSMLLIGDIIEKTNMSTHEKTYEIMNARVTYDKIPIVLLSNENSVCIANKKRTKHKLINYQTFVDALNDVDKRNDMIDW